MSNKNSKNLTERRYRKVKELFDQGLDRNQVEMATELSRSTILLIEQTENFLIYKFLKYSYNINTKRKELGFEPISIEEQLKSQKILWINNCWRQTGSDKLTFKDLEDFRTKFLQSYLPKREEKGTVTLPNTSDFSGGISIQDLTGQPIMAQEKESSLDAEVDKLDELFSQIKEQLIKVVELSVEERTKEVIREKDAEMVALKTVVEAAKSQNLASILKDRLMGSRGTI